MRVLIFGAEGMLGSELVKVFGDAKSYYELATPSFKDVDISNYNDVHKIVDDVQPAFIINAAAYTDVDGAETNKDQAFRVNFEGTQNIANLAADMRLPIVHYSTDYVFPGTNKEGYNEDDKPGPAVNAYGQSKLAGEDSLRKIKPRFYLIRTAWLYGANGNNFVETMLGLGQDHSELNIVNDQVGSPTFAKDLAVATRQLLDKDYEPGTYHLVNSGQTNWAKFAEEIFKLTKLQVKVSPIPSSEYPLPAKRPEYSVLNNNRGPKLRAWQEALAEYLGTRNMEKEARA